MNRLRRALFLLAVSLAVTAIALVFRGLTLRGAFTDVSRRFTGSCSSIAGSADDLEWDAQDGLLFASVPRATHQLQAGIYTLSPGGTFTRLNGGPSNFHPTGLGLFRESPGALVLMVVDRPSGQDPSVDIFDVKKESGALALVQRASITGGELSDPVDVAPTGADQFYATNGDTSTTTLGRTFARFGLLSRGDVVYFDGNLFHVAVDGLKAAHSIRAEGSRGRVYVTGGRSLYAFERDPLSGSLSEAGELVVGPGLSNMASDEKGNLWIAARLKPLARLGLGNAATAPLASQVYRVSLSSGPPAGVDLIYSDPGQEVDGASAVAVANGKIFIGTPRASRILVCKNARP